MKQAMAVHGRTVPRRATISAAPSALVHLGWFAAGSAIAFLAPYVFSSRLELQHDVYYVIYFAVALAFLGAYATTTRADLAGLFRRNWRWSLALSVPVSAFLVANVFSRESTAGVSDGYLAFELGWRGVAYGVVDALVLTAFPGLVAFSLLAGDLRGLRRKAMYVALMLPLVLFITGVYHYGYAQFREDGVGGPLTGNAIISIPMIVTANPVGSIVAHASMHVAAEAHSHETDLFLPPQTNAD